MPHCFVLQPNGKYAIWSSISDDFIRLDLGREEAIQAEFRMSSSARMGPYPGGDDALMCDMRREMANIDATGQGWQWSPTWQKAVHLLYHFNGPDHETLVKIRELGLPDDPPPLCPLCQKGYQNVVCGQCRQTVCDDCANEEQDRCKDCLVSYLPNPAK